jgi:hypothetical protein
MSTIANPRNLSISGLLSTSDIVFAFAVFYHDKMMKIQKNKKHKTNLERMQDHRNFF